MLRRHVRSHAHSLPGRRPGLRQPGALPGRPWRTSSQPGPRARHGPRTQAYEAAPRARRAAPALIRDGSVSIACRPHSHVTLTRSRRRHHEVGDDPTVRDPGERARPDRPHPTPRPRHGQGVAAAHGQLGQIRASPPQRRRASCRPPVGQRPERSLLGRRIEPDGTAAPVRPPFRAPTGPTARVGSLRRGEARDHDGDPRRPIFEGHPIARPPGDDQRLGRRRPHSRLYTTIPPRARAGRRGNPACREPGFDPQSSARA